MKQFRDQLSWTMPTHLSKFDAVPIVWPKFVFWMNRWYETVPSLIHTFKLQTYHLFDSINIELLINPKHTIIHLLKYFHPHSFTTPFNIWFMVQWICCVIKSTFENHIVNINDILAPDLPDKIPPSSSLFECLITPINDFLLFQLNNAHCNLINEYFLKKLYFEHHFFCYYIKHLVS